jgi:hypothetical protein
MALSILCTHQLIFHSLPSSQSPLSHARPLQLASSAIRSRLSVRAPEAIETLRQVAPLHKKLLAAGPCGTFPSWLHLHCCRKCFVLCEQVSSVYWLSCAHGNEGCATCVLSVDAAKADEVPPLPWADYCTTPIPSLIPMKGWILARIHRCT